MCVCVYRTCVSTFILYARAAASENNGRRPAIKKLCGGVVDVGRRRGENARVCWATVQERPKIDRKNRFENTNYRGRVVLYNVIQKGYRLVRYVFSPRVHVLSYYYHNIILMHIDESASFSVVVLDYTHFIRYNAKKKKKVM